MRDERSDEARISRPVPPRRAKALVHDQAVDWAA
jgi:hypothetical protein